ncbi:hypothetical protein Misp02_47000 [Microtetraspora sp. NBRC 16547]|nr:hypothetical protein Misp02_47000 [Microtetraspora sp. NBRC 16547]
MARHVSDHTGEWRATLEDPEKLRRFVSFVNAPDTPDPSIVFEPERDQIKPVILKIIRPRGMPATLTSAPTGKVCPVGAVSRVVHRKAEEEVVAEPTGDDDNAARCRPGRRDGAKIDGRGTGMRSNAKSHPSCRPSRAGMSSDGSET